jgi:hypothetical protein
MNAVKYRSPTPQLRTDAYYTGAPDPSNSVGAPTKCKNRSKQNINGKSRRSVEAAIQLKKDYNMTSKKRNRKERVKGGHASTNRFHAVQKIETMINVTTPHIISVIRKTGQWDGDAAGFSLEDSGLFEIIATFLWFKEPLNKTWGECVLKEILEIDDNVAQHILDHVEKNQHITFPCELLSMAQLTAWARLSVAIKHIPKEVALLIRAMEDQIFGQTETTAVGVITADSLGAIESDLNRNAKR